MTSVNEKRSAAAKKAAATRKSNKAIAEARAAKDAEINRNQQQRSTEVTPEMAADRVENRTFELLQFCLQSVAEQQLNPAQVTDHAIIVRDLAVMAQDAQTLDRFKAGVRMNEAAIQTGLCRKLMNAATTTLVRAIKASEQYAKKAEAHGGIEAFQQFMDDLNQRRREAGVAEYAGTQNVGLFSSINEVDREIVIEEAVSALHDFLSDIYTIAEFEMSQDWVGYIPEGLAYAVMPTDEVDAEGNTIFRPIFSLSEAVAAKQEAAARYREEKKAEARDALRASASAFSGK